MVIVPLGWEEIPGLVSGFGGRGDAPAGDALAMLKQVHGNSILAAEDVIARDEELEGDALSVVTAGLTAAIRTADCCPILLIAPEQRWAAVIHAGWRGTVADIVGVSVRTAEACGLSAEGLYAAIGPAIGACCYEVGDEVAMRFEEEGLEVDRSGAKPVLDLRELNRRRLLAAGLRASRIQICGPCTRCHSDAYWSYRADPRQAGRQLSWIGWARQTPDRDRPESPSRS
jgi:YfiH family protein